VWIETTDEGNCHEPRNCITRHSWRVWIETGWVGEAAARPQASPAIHGGCGLKLVALDPMDGEVVHHPPFMAGVD